MMLRQPAEWMRHGALWSAWPSAADLWQEDLDAARAEVAALYAAIADVDPATGQPRGEALNILVHGDEARDSAAVALAGLGATLIDIPFGDIWLRDTAPIFVVDDAHRLAAASFGFNGWGGKYDLPHDAGVSRAIAAASGLPTHRFDWVLEGGSIDVDGAGRGLTTEQCLLNRNRNPDLDRATIERYLAEQLGVSVPVWLGEGLANDHTDGHVDNLARFVAPGVAVVPEARDSDDPNTEVYRDARQRLRAAGLEVVTVPSVGRLENEDGDVVPASYMNFYIANTTVVVPTYGSRWDDAAVEAIGRLFPGRRAVGCRANAILTGGGSFHCITQQVPSLPLEEI